MYPDDADVCANDGSTLHVVGAEQGPPPGATLGQYRIIEKIGDGAMGYVFLAEHARLGRRVALKLMKREYSGNPQTVARFFGEARAVNQINHDNIVQITDFFDQEGDEKYYIMELLEGQTLGELIQAEGVLPLRRTMNIAVQATSALQAVHDAGIIHRDLKPDNVFLIERAGKTDFVKILDFGVAKITDLSGVSLSGTAAGSILGTPEYMSPEQVSGGEIDPRSDIYSVGVVLYELVGGRRPLEAKTFGEMVIKHMTVEPPPLSALETLRYAIPAELEALIRACLAKEPEQRPQSMAEVTENLRYILAELPAEDQPAPPPRRPRNNKVGYIAAASGGAVLIASLIFALTRGDGPEADYIPEIPEPVMAQAPVAPLQAELRFSSVPAGAEVYRPGGDVPVGRTPFSLTVAVSEDVSTYEFRMPGFEAAVQEVTPTTNSEIEVHLKKKKTGKRRTGKNKKKGKVDTRGTIDPFAQ